MKIGALIPIRLDSERLPGKALLPILDRPVVHHLLDRVCASRYIENPRDVVVCTTEDPSDDPLVESVEGYGCSAFRGDRDDIIKRFRDAIEVFELDAVIQVDGDDPLSATEYMDLTMDQIVADGTLDIVTCDGLPFGIATKSFTRDAMEKVFASYRTTENDTGFISFFTKTGICKQKTITPISSDHIHEEARLTLDYDVDLELFRRIFGALYKPGKIFGLAEVVKFLREHPEDVQINKGVDEEYWSRWTEKASLRFVDADGSERTI